MNGALKGRLFMPWHPSRISALLLASGLLLLLVACQTAQAPTSPISVELQALDAKPLGNVMRLEATVISSVDAPNTEITFRLLNSMTLVTGQLQYTVQLEQDVPQTFELDIKPREIGVHKVSADATVDYAVGTRFGGGAVLFLKVTSTKTEIWRELPQTPHGDQSTTGLTPTPAR